MFPFDLIIVAN
jgi:hypothetical protein